MNTRRRGKCLRACVAVWRKEEIQFCTFFFALLSLSPHRIYFFWSWYAPLLQQREMRNMRLAKINYWRQEHTTRERERMRDAAGEMKLIIEIRVRDSIRQWIKDFIPLHNDVFASRPSTRRRSLVATMKNEIGCSAPSNSSEDEGGKAHKFLIKASNSKSRRVCREKIKREEQKLGENLFIIFDLQKHSCGARLECETLILRAQCHLSE